MVTFPIVSIRRVIGRGKEDVATNGRFRNPYYGTRPGEGETPGIWLVGDQGINVMCNGKLAEGQKPLVVYAEQCRPKGHLCLCH